MKRAGRGDHAPRRVTEMTGFDSARRAPAARAAATVNANDVTRPDRPDDDAGNRASASTAGDFERALLLDAAAMDASILQCLGDNAAHRPDDMPADELRRFCATLFAVLRSPLFPKKSYAPLAAMLREAMRPATTPIRIIIVLASPTAQAEIGSFLDILRLCRRHGLNVRPHILFIRWENLVDVGHLGLAPRQRDFETRLALLAQEVRVSGFADVAITPVNIVASERIGDAEAPPEFAEAFTNVSNAVSDAGKNDAPLWRNITWTTGFYARQNSLKRLGEAQPLIDLSIRAGVGNWLGKTSSENEPCLLLTSELNQRFLSCYNTTRHIANISLNARLPPFDVGRRPFRVVRETEDADFVPSLLAEA